MSPAVALRWLTIGQAAQYLGYATSTIYHEVSAR
jgi:predicted DNA-binding transcriptional regulator AlpA